MVYTMKYRYKLTSTGNSSDRYGKCEVCNENVSDVFVQTEERQFWNKWKQKISWTHDGCKALFGHKACLEKAQKKRVL